MPFGLHILKNVFQDASRNIRETKAHLKEKHAELRDMMKEDPQVRVAVYHGLTYAACLLGPLAVGTYFSVTRDGSWNVFRVPDAVEKVEIHRDTPLTEPTDYRIYEP